jgi:hypothetical protein
MASNLSTDRGAVTSALGTGITIGIAILLAVGLAIMVRVFTDQDEATPPVAFAKDEQGDSIQVLQAEPGMMHSEFEVRLSVAGDFEFGGPVQPGGDALPANVFVRLGGVADGPADGEMVSGHMFRFCAEPGAGDVTIEVRHMASNTIIFREHFLSLADCPA